MRILSKLMESILNAVKHFDTSHPLSELTVAEKKERFCPSKLVRNATMETSESRLDAKFVAKCFLSSGTFLGFAEDLPN